MQLMIDGEQLPPLDAGEVGGAPGRERTMETYAPKKSLRVWNPKCASSAAAQARAAAQGGWAGRPPRRCTHTQAAQVLLTHNPSCPALAPPLAPPLLPACRTGKLGNKVLRYPASYYDTLTGAPNGGAVFFRAVLDRALYQRIRLIPSVL